ncbi:MAG: hypothetical protein SGCHY_001431 [Lobulomycetales sp.]
MNEGSGGGWFGNLSKAYEKSKELASKASNSLQDQVQAAAAAAAASSASGTNSPKARQDSNASPQDMQVQQTHSRKTSSAGIARAFSSTDLNVSRSASPSQEYSDLARAYKNLQKKNTMIETMLFRATPITSIASPADLDIIESYIRDLVKRTSQDMNEDRLLADGAGSEPLLGGGSPEPPLISLDDDNLSAQVHQLTQQRDVAVEKARAFHAEKQALQIRLSDALEKIEMIAPAKTLDRRRSSIEIREEEASMQARMNSLQARLDVSEKSRLEMEASLSQAQASVQEEKEKAQRKDRVAENLAVKVKKLEEAAKLSVATNGTPPVAAESVPATPLDNQLVNYQTEITDLNEIIRIKTEANERASQNLALLSDELSEAKKEAQKGQDRIDELTNKTRALLKLKEEERDAAVDEAKSQMQLAVTKITELESKLASTASSGNEQLEQARTKIAELESQVASTASSGNEELEQARTKIAELESQAASSEATSGKEIEQARAKITELESQVASTASSGNEELEQARAKIAELQSQAASSEATSGKELEQARAKITELESQVASTASSGNEELEQARAKIAELESQVASTASSGNEQLEQARAKIAELESQVASTASSGNEELEQARTKIAELESEIENKAVVSPRTNELLVTAQAKVEELKEDLSDANARIESMQQQLDDSLHKQEKVVVVESQLRQSEESLALSKQSLHSHEGTIEELRQELEKTRKSLSEEEEKKTKSINLLRNSKARILKLEAEVRSSRETGDRLKEETSSQTSGLEEKIASLQKELRDAGSKKAQEVEAARKDALGEMETLNGRVKSLDSQKELLSSQLQAKTGLAESLQEKLNTATAQLSSQGELVKRMPLKIKELEEQVMNLNADLETSNRLYETKSIENDTFKPRISELEAQVYKSSELAERRLDEIDLVKREAADLRQQLAAKVSLVSKCEADIIDAQRKAEAKIQEADDRVKLVEEGLATLEALKGEKALAETQLQEAVVSLKTEKAKLQSLEAQIKEQKSTSKAEALEREAELEEMKIREVQLKNVNKALKEEVRKLSRSLSSAPSSVAGSPMMATTLTLTSPTNGALQNSMGASSMIPQSSDGRRKSSVGSLSGHTRAHGTVSGIPLSQESLPEPNPEYLKHVFLKFIDDKAKRVCVSGGLTLYCRAN